MFVASHKHEHLKRLISQRGPLCLQDVLALVEGAFFLLHAGLYLQLHGHFNGIDAVQFI